MSVWVGHSEMHETRSDAISPSQNSWHCLRLQLLELRARCSSGLHRPRWHSCLETTQDGTGPFHRTIRWFEEQRSAVQPTSEKGYWEQYLTLDQRGLWRVDDDFSYLLSCDSLDQRVQWIADILPEEDCTALIYQAAPLLGGQGT